MKFAPLTLLLAGLLLCGCAATPRDRYAQADRRLGIAADAVKAAVDSRYFDDKPAVLKAMKFGLLEANALQAKAKPLALRGESLALDDYLDSMEAAIARVLAALATKDGAK